MKPGASTSPRASITRAPDGTLTWPRRPTATMESPLMTTAELLMGARPEPSIRVAPRMTIVVTSCNIGHGLYRFTLRLVCGLVFGAEEASTVSEHLDSGKSEFL